MNGTHRRGPIAFALTAVLGGLLASGAVRAQDPPAWTEAVPGVLVSQQSSATFTAYFRVVADYRAGRVDAAVRLIGGWSMAQLQPFPRQFRREFETRLRVCPEKPEHTAAIWVDAAVLLHTEAAFAALVQHNADEAHVHLDVARALLDLIPLRGAEARSLDRALGRTADAARAGTACGAPRPMSRSDWLLTVTLLTLRPWAVSIADEFATLLARAAPDDADALHAVGAVREAQAVSTANDHLPPPAWRLNEFSYSYAQQRFQKSLRDVKRLREEAARLFERALARNADRHDIRLRLGWVQARLERPGPARTNLERVVAHASTPGDRYLAALFLGRLAEKRSDLDAALRWYEHATTIDPEGYIARTARAHALDRQGHLDRAREVLRQSVSDASSSSGDPWSTYPLGPWSTGEATLNRLRAEVTIR